LCCPIPGIHNIPRLLPVRTRLTWPENRAEAPSPGGLKWKDGGWGGGKILVKGIQKPAWQKED